MRTFGIRGVAAAAATIIGIGLVASATSAGEPFTSFGERRLAKPSARNVLRQGSERGGLPRLETSAELLASGAARTAARRGTIGDDFAAAHLAAFAAAKRIPAALGPSLGNRWSEAGPKPFHADGADYSLKILGWDVVSGRVTALATVPGDDTGNKIWVGTAGGGAWYSADAGKTWTPRFDGQPMLGVGAIAVDPKNPKTVFVGTGEPNTNGDAFYGVGIFRSRDNGATWQRVAQNLPKTATVFRIEIAGGRIFAATNRGLYRSTNGGDSWHDVRLPTNTAGTAPDAGIFSNFVTDVRSNPQNQSEITAVVGWRKGKTGPANKATGNGFYRSITGGGPGSFTRMSVSGFEKGSRGSDPIGRTSFVYSPHDPNVMWAIVQDAGRFGGETFLGLPLPNVNPFNGVYRSGDGGQTWDLKATPESFATAPGSGLVLGIALLYTPGIQSWYNQWIAVDPADPDRVLVGLEEIYQTAANANGDGLASWKTVGRYWNACLLLEAAPPCDVFGGPYAGKTTHPDQHAFALAKTADGVRLYAGNDGGVYRQDVQSDGYANDRWTSVNDTLGTAQAYYGVIGGDGTIWAGFQDNGTAKITPDGHAEMVYGGDGFDVAVDPADSDVAYEEYVAGAMSITKDGGKTWHSADPGLTAALFSTPFEMDEKDPKHIVIVGRQIAESTDGAETACNDPITCSWVFSYDLGRKGDAPALGESDTRPNWQSSAVDVSGADVYVGFCGVCDIVVQGNGDETTFSNGIATNVKGGCTPQIGTDTCWEKVVRPKGLPNRYITDVAIDPADRNTVYVTLMGYGRRWLLPSDKAPGAGRGNVFVSRDAGRTFTDISGNLPQAPTNAVLLREDRLYVGNDFGVFTRPKSGGTWERLGAELPNASVWDLNLNPQATKMVAATHGRGLWVYEFGGAPKAPAKPRVHGTKRTRPLPATGLDPATGFGIGLILTGALLARRVRSAR